MCYVDTPVASQVVLAKTLQNDKKRTAVLQKIALQINCKLGGELWASQCAIKNIMVIGIDTFHDPDRKGCSIAGFISSMNGSFSRWLSTTCRQVLTGLKKIFAVQLHFLFILLARQPRAG